MKVYSIYDSKAAVWSNPVYFRSRGEAIRSWSEAVNDKQTSFSKYAEDYTMFEIGDWDEKQGVITPYSTPHSVGLASNFKVLVDAA